MSHIKEDSRSGGRVRSVLSVVVRCFWDPLAITRSVRMRAITESARYARGLVVDIGSGQQTYRSRYEPVADRIIAVEYPDPAPKTDVDIWGDIQHLPIQDGVADTVLCFGVLEIVPEPPLAMKEMERILKPGGRLLLVAAQIRGASNESNDYWRFGRPGVRLLAEKVGLEEVELKPCGGLLAAIGQRASAALNQALVKRREWPHRMVALLCGFVQAPCWLVDQLGFAKDDTLHWLLIAQKPRQ